MSDPSSPTRLVDDVEALARAVAQQPCTCVICDDVQQQSGDPTDRCPACKALALLQRFGFHRVRVR